jgi:hypothetical protein
MRSSRAIAFYLNGFHLLSLVPAVPSHRCNPVIIAGESWGETGEDFPVTELGIEYFHNHQQYHDLLQEYESRDHRRPHWSDELCAGHLHGICNCVRPLINLFADSGD